MGKSFKLKLLGVKFFFVKTVVTVFIELTKEMPLSVVQKSICNTPAGIILLSLVCKVFMGVTRPLKTTVRPRVFFW